MNDATDKPPQRLRLMKRTHGDLVLAEWDASRPETIEHARRAWSEHRTAGMLAFRLDGKGEQTLIAEFDEDAPEILLVPAIQGG